MSDASSIGKAGQEAARQMTKSGLSKFEFPKLDAKVALAAGSILLVTGVAVGGYMWITSRRSSELERPLEELAQDDSTDPDCLIDFRAALKNYVDAGSSGCLTPGIIDDLMTQLDAVQAYTDGGNAIVISLVELMPFFELITAHTPVLAAAFGLDLSEIVVADDDVVVSLRSHLEIQRGFLESAA